MTAPLATRTPDRPDWSDYLAGFHASRPGVTERVLGRTGRGTDDPYGWLLAAVPSHGLVLDVACGNAPLWSRLASRRCLGTDVSDAELAAARTRGARGLVQAAASSLPLPDSGVDVVVCSMALQVICPLPAALAEIGRVLRPGGRLVATVPARSPLRAVDLPALAGLLAGLGRGLVYPNDDALRRLPELLAAAGLRSVADERRRFTYPLDSPADAEVFLASLYLPGLPGRRYRAAQRWLRALARTPANLPVPIRRVVATRIS